MRKVKYRDTQIASILKEAEAGMPVPELCRDYGMNVQMTTDVALVTHQQSANVLSM